MGNEIMRHAMATADVIAGSLATPNARATWTVYRDGYRWTVGAKHLPDALRRACLQTDSMSGQQFVDAGARRELCEAPAPNGLPIALRCFTREIEAIYCDGLTAHVVDVSDTITHAQALDVLARAREDFVAVWAAALAAMVWVWDENGEPVTVRCYKTGAKGLSARSHFSRYQTTGKLERDGSIEWHNASLMPELLGILQRDDLIKWPRKTSAEEKARMLAGVVHNAALDEYVTAMQATLVFDTERACQRLVPPPKHVDEMTEVELRKRKAQHEAELAELPPNATARHEITTRDHDTRSRHEITTQLAAVQRRLDVFDSINEHGFDVGTLVDVLPAPWDDEQITRRARVVEVVVEHKPTYFDREPETQHRRVVEFFDGSDSTRPETHRLRATT
jgi:hypothetical protein